MSAFALAATTIFRDPHMALDALYLARGVGPGVPVRIIRQAPDQVSEWGGGRFVSDSVRLDVLAADARLEQGDRFIIAGNEFDIIGEPLLDAEHLIWKAEARAV